MPPVVQFFELARAKQILEISADDTEDDALLNQLGRGADQTFKNWILSKQDELPTDEEITDDMRNAVAFKVAARYQISKKEWDGARLWNEEYQTAIEGIRIGIDQGQEAEYLIARRY